MTTGILVGAAALALALLLVGARRLHPARPKRTGNSDAAGWIATDTGSDRDDAGNDGGGGGNEGGGGGGGDGGGD